MPAPVSETRISAAPSGRARAAGGKPVSDGTRRRRPKKAGVGPTAPAKPRPTYDEPACAETATDLRAAPRLGKLRRAGGEDRAAEPSVLAGNLGLPAGAVELVGPEAPPPDQAETMVPRPGLRVHFRGIGAMTLFQEIETDTGQLPGRWRGPRKTGRGFAAGPRRKGEQLRGGPPRPGTEGVLSKWFPLRFEADRPRGCRRLVVAVSRPR